LDCYRQQQFIFCPDSWLVKPSALIVWIESRLNVTWTWWWKRQQERGRPYYTIIAWLGLDGGSSGKRERETLYMIIWLACIAHKISRFNCWWLNNTR
jgi:hypothetical protein